MGAHKSSLKKRNAVRTLAELNTKKSIPLIEQRLEDPDFLVRNEAIRALTKLNSKQSLRLIKKGIKDKAPIVRHNAANALHSFSTKIEHHRLYSGQDKAFFDKKRKIVREKFEKNGSKIILLGGKLTGKTIIRILPETAFIAWKKAFTSKAWRKAGFDYVPVEPILRKNGKLRVRKGKDGKYRVSTFVLGQNLVSFLANPANKKYEQKLRNDKYAICQLLEILINHGHAHDGNFCVKMHKNKPRLYVIDFDLAQQAY